MKLPDLRPQESDGPADWWLRYRWHPGPGVSPLGWATISAILEEQGNQGIRHSSVPASRTLDPILGTARAEDPERCACYGVVTWPATGG